MTKTDRFLQYKEQAYGICMEVYKELGSAVDRFPPFNSAHEGYAIIKEEVDELWDEVKNNKNNDPDRQRKEAIQVASTAVRFVMDISNKGMHRNERTELINWGRDVDL